MITSGVMADSLGVAGLHTLGSRQRHMAETSAEASAWAEAWEEAWEEV